MKYTRLPSIFILLVIIASNSTLFSQDCLVAQASLKGTYIGDLRTGKRMEKEKLLESILMKVSLNPACLMETVCISGAMGIPITARLKKV